MPDFDGKGGVFFFFPCGIERVGKGVGVVLLVFFILLHICFIGLVMRSGYSFFCRVFIGQARWTGHG